MENITSQNNNSFKPILVSENKSALPNDDIQSVNNDLDDEIPF